MIAGRRWPARALLGAAVGLYLAAAVLGPAPRSGTAAAAWFRDLSRPLILPLLWRGIERARRAGRVGEVFERGRALLALVPCWVDGYVFFADALVFGVHPDRASPREGLDALAAALALLEEAARACPARADEVLATMAFLVEQRARLWPELGRAFEDRYGEHPVGRAAAYLERAERARGSGPLRERRAYLAVRLVAPALERGDLALALARIDEALRLLADVPDQKTAARQRAALVRLRRYLTGDPAVPYEGLLEDPWLADLAPVLPRRR